MVFLLAGGLSSPVIVLILPVLYLRVYWYRRLSSELLIAISATLITAVQISFIVKGSASRFSPLDSVAKNVIPEFFGRFMIGNWTDNSIILLLVGIGLIGILAKFVFYDRHNRSIWILLYLLLGSIALTVARIDPASIHPEFAGPRYFFFPFILTFWILIQFFYVTQSVWSRALAMRCSFSLVRRP